MSAVKDAAEVLAAGGESAIKARRERHEVLAVVPDEQRGVATKTMKASNAVTTINTKARTVCLADVAPERVEWLWQDRIPFGMLTLLDGDPGLGKSTLTLDLVARVSRGDAMPESAPSASGREPFNAIVLMLEDALAHTIRPRLDAAGADVARVFAMTGILETPTDPDSERPPVLPVDIGSLRCTIQTHKARLVIIDPLMAYLGADTDSHKDQDIRRALTPLARLAEETGAAIIIVRHLRKSPGPAKYRGGGSIGITASARVGLLLAEDPADKEARILAVFKSNIAKVPPALRWRPVTSGEVAKAQWEGVAEGVTADQLSNVGQATRGGKSKEGRSRPVDLATEALKSLLADGPVMATEAEHDVIESSGCGARTVRRAFKRLGGNSSPQHDDRGRVVGWQWSLPTEPNSAPLPGAD